MAGTDTRADLRAETAVATRRRMGLSAITPASKYYWVRLLAQNRVAAVSFVFMLIVMIASLAAPLISDYDPTYVDPANRLQSPSRDHWFGTDTFGRDIFTRALYGARVSLLVGLSVMIVAAFSGSVIGLISGYYDRFDSILMRIMDGLMAFPSILLAIAIMASLGPRTSNVIIALSVVYTPTIARLVRGTTLVNRRLAYVESARSIGMRDHLILRRYVYMNSLSPLIVQCTFVVAFAIISEASLSFLGAGVPPETPTWGNMVRDGQAVLQRAWWLAVLPGSLLFLTVLALNLLGDGLRDALDPRSRER
jgi:peptide/nickel transport system permease protein